MKKKALKMNSLETLLANTIGYLHLVVTPYSPGDKLQAIKIDNRLFSIIKGIYISPYADSLFKDICILCLILLGS